MPVTTAAIYTRISQDADRQGLGVARQESDCRALVEGREWQLGEVYCDNDLSAFTTRKVRPAYQRLLEDLRAGRVDAVVAWHPDRLHRSPRELEDFIDVIERSGALVATCTSGDYDLANPDGRLMARIVGSVARKESEDKSRRLRRKHQELAEGGELSGGGHRPYGYGDDRVSINEEEAALVREAAGRVIAGESIRAVVLDWNQRGVATVTGARWSPTTLKRLLTSGRIAGHRTHHGKATATATWPAIITEAEAARLKAILGPQRTRGAGRGSATPRSYLLSGILRCARCEAFMTARPVVRKGIRYRRYACAQDRGGCGRVGIGAQPLEELVTEAVLIRLDSAEMASAMSSASDESVVELRAAIDEDRDALAELTQARYVDRIIDHAEFAAARARLEERIEATQAQLRGRSVGWTGSGEMLRASWQELDIERRWVILDSMIERVTITATSRADNRFNPERVNVIWRA